MRPLFLLCLVIGCDGKTLDPSEDIDGDGFSTDQGDCDEGDASIFPGADEACDGVDSDCDGADGGPSITGPLWYEDTDGDGFGDDTTATAACDAPGADWVDVGGDCAVSDATASPQGTEVCDDVDNDCDGSVDEELPAVFADLDGDGFGDPSSPLEGCETGEGRVADDQDCDDADASVNPDTIWYYDADLDGWGLDTLTDSGCESPGPDYASQLGDCRPNDPNAYPGAPEICDNGNQPQNIDDNCNGFVDEGCRQVFDCEDIDEDTVWSGTIIVSCDVTVGALDTPTLTIEDGTTVRFGQGNSLVVGPLAPGRLVVEDGPLGVRFTADALDPLPGDWEGVLLAAADGSVLDNLTIAYAGADDSPALTVRADDVQMNGLSIVDAASDGMVVYGTDVSGSDFSASAVGGDAVVCEPGGDLSLDGVSVSGSSGVMVTRLDCADAFSGDLSFEDNEREYISVSGLTLSETTTWSALGIPYVLDQGMNVSGEEEVILTLEPGVNIEVAEGHAVRVGAAGEGGLIANGTQSEPITFSSASGNPAPGDWDGLVFQDDTSVSQLTHVSVAHAGGGSVRQASVELDTPGTSVVASHLTVQDGAGDGVQVWAGQLDLSDCTLRDNAGAGLRVEAFGSLSAPVTGCSVTGNGVAAQFGNADSVAALDPTSTWTGNTDDRVLITDLTLEASSVWEDLGIPLYIENGLTVASSVAPTALQTNGVTLQFAQGTQLQVGMTSSRTGTLDAVDTTFEGEVSGPGAWMGVGVRGAVTLTNSTVRGAGGNSAAAVEVYTGPAVLTDSLIDQAADIGVRCWPGFAGITLEDMTYTSVPTPVSGCPM